MGEVYISRKFEPSVENVEQALKRAYQASSEVAQLLEGCSSALVKPNLATTGNHEKATANPIVIEGVITFLQGCGIEDITVGEGCGGGADAREVFDVTGVAEIAQRHDAKLVDLNLSEQIELPVPDGLLLEKVKVAREVAQAELLVNVPTLKTHHAAFISVAMKNLKGVLSWPGKRRFHQQGLFESIVDLSSAVSQHLVIVDATRAMEGRGPFHGDPVPLNRLLVGTDTLGVDIVSTRIMGFDLDEVPTVRMALDAGLAAAEPVVLGATVQEVREPLGRSFVRPPSGPTLELTYGTVCFGEKVCSGCVGQFHGVCALVEDLPWLPSEKLIGFYVGDVAAAYPPEPKVAVMWGSCAVAEARRMRTDQGERCLFVPGCPPDPGTMREAFQKLHALYE